MPDATLIFMIKPPPALRPALVAHRHAYGLDPHYGPERFHCTMLWLDDAARWSGAAFDRLVAQAAEVCVPPFPVMFDRAEGQVLKGTGSRQGVALHQALLAAAKGCGVDVPPRDFRLHLSLSYKGPRIDGARKVDPPVRWVAEEFLLIRSANSQHDVLGRWPLRARQYALAL